MTLAPSVVISSPARPSGRSSTVLLPREKGMRSLRMEPSTTRTQHARSTHAVAYPRGHVHDHVPARAGTPSGSEWAQRREGATRDLIPALRR